MKKTLFILGLLLLTVTAVFAQAKTPKAKKIIDKNVPIEESAILYFPGGSVVFQYDDTKFGVVGPFSFMNLKGRGGDYSGRVARPILQIPAGNHTITAAFGKKYYDGRKVTFDFLPGRYYQMQLMPDYSNGVGSGFGSMALTTMLGGADWCFVDITDEVKAGKNSFREKWEALAFKGELGKDHVIEMYGNLNSLRK
jgi:hypothetical protein